MSASRDSSPSSAAVLLPAEAFFVRRVALDAAAAAAGQVEIALEGLAPFGLGQLYHGHRVGSGGTQALVFATHRRLFSADDWKDAAAVLPAFVALLGEPPATARLRTWTRPGAVVAAAWDGGGDLPAHVVARVSAPGDEASLREALVREISARLGTEAAVEEFAGEAVPVEAKGEGVEFVLEGGGGRRLRTVLAREAVEAMDVRDKGFLSGSRAAARRDGWLWRGLQAAGAAIGIAVVMEAVLFAGGLLVRQQRAAVDAAAPGIERIQTAQALGTRIDELSQRRLRPFEMLAIVNQVRPPGVVFSRTATAGQAGLEIEAQTANADTVGIFESALRALPVAEGVEVRDLRLRDGLTTFQLSVRFREAALAALPVSGGAR
jgi:hypothetical protein